jgi:hypothetical protein
VIALMNGVALATETLHKRKKSAGDKPVSALIFFEG